MSTKNRRALGAFAAAFLMLVACNASGQLVPTAIELVQLPKFCYGKANVPNATGPEFNLPTDCGAGVNHFCSGLIHLIRAKSSSGGKNKVISELGLAENDIRYTEGWIAPFPNCSIREQVAKARAEVNGLMTAYGMKPPGKK